MAQSNPQNDPAVDDVATRLGATNFWRCGWNDLDEVQKADAIEALMEAAERFARSNIEGRPISREEHESELRGGLSPADEAPR